MNDQQTLATRDRDALRGAFIHAHGRCADDCEALPADASFRRYFRLHDGAAPLLVMDAPPGLESVMPFVRIARLLRALDLSAPRIVAVDAVLGFVLIEDFGDDTFTRLMAGGHSQAPLYDLATDALITLHRHAVPDDIELPHYDEDRLLGEAALFTDWFYAALLGKPCDSSARQAYLHAWSRIFSALAPLRERLVLRDYHVDNLMLLPDRDAHRACGLLDFQDALRGPIAYDLVSLVEDARRDVPDEVRARVLERYLRAFPELDAAHVARWCAVLGAQRHAKVAGIFVRLCARDGKGVYLQHVPRVVALLASHLDNPALAPLKAWMDRHLPTFLSPLPGADVIVARRLQGGARR